MLGNAYEVQNYLGKRLSTTLAKRAKPVKLQQN